MKAQNRPSPYQTLQARGLSAVRRPIAHQVTPWLAAGVLLMAAYPAQSAGTTRTWTGNTTANWNAVDGFDGVPVAGDLLVFGAAGSQGTMLNNDLPASTIFASMTFNPGASSYKITNPNTYLSSPAYITSFTTGITNNSGVLQVLDMDTGLYNGAVLAGSNFELTAGHNLISNQGSGSASISATGLILDPGSSLQAFSGRTLTQTAASTITAGMLTKASVGLLVLGGVNSYAGGTNVTAGTLRLSGAGTLGATTGALTVGSVNYSGATLDLNGTNQTVDGLSGSNTNAGNPAPTYTNTITNTGANTTSTLTIGSNNGGGTYNGGIRDGSATATTAIVKNGTGVENFTVVAANTGTFATNYSGGTTVNGGTLQLGSADADGVGAVTVNSGGTVTVTANTALGSSTAHAGAVTLNGGTLLNANAGATGAASNQQTAGTLALTNGSLSTLDFGMSNAGATFTFADSAATLGTGALQVLDWTGTAAAGGVGGYDASDLDQLFIGTTNSLAAPGLINDIAFVNPNGVAGTFGAVQLANGAIVANLAAAPEPSQWSAMLLGSLSLGALVLRARRRRGMMA